MRREGKDNVHFLVKWRGEIIFFLELVMFVQALMRLILSTLRKPRPRFLRFSVCYCTISVQYSALMQVVIDFYEEKLAWFTGEDSQEEE